MSVVPTIQWLRHGMMNSTDFSVRRIIPVSDGILSRATRKCTPFDALTRNRPRVPAACCIWSVHTPVQLTTTEARTSASWPVSTSRTRTPATRSTSWRNSTTWVEVRTTAPYWAAVRPTIIVWRASSAWASK